MNSDKERIIELEDKLRKMEDLFDALRLPFDLDEIDIDSIFVNYTEELDLRNGSKSFKVAFEYEEIKEEQED